MPTFLTGLTAKLVGLGLIVLLIAGLWVRGQHFRNQRDDARHQVVLWKDANDKARAWALAEKAVKEASATAAKEKADVERRAAQSGDRAAADAYVARNRCVRAEAPAGQRPDLPRTNPPAGKPQSAPPPAELAGIDRADLDACTVNSRDIVNAQAWAADAMAKGLAR